MRAFTKLPGGTAKCRGFSLVEVVLALGIVAFALTSIVGIFGVLVSRAGDNAERREMRDAMNSLGAYLNQGETLEAATASGRNFGRVYDWVKNSGSQEFLGVTYHADQTGRPDATKEGTVRSIWFPRGASLSNGLTLDTIEAARGGRWMSAKVILSKNNPLQQLPGQADEYEYAHLVVTAVMNAIETPSRQSLTDAERTTRTRLEVPLVVLR